MKKIEKNFVFVFIPILVCLFFVSCNDETPTTNDYIPFRVMISVDTDVPPKYSYLDFDFQKDEAYMKVVSLNKKIVLSTYTRFKDSNGDYLTDWELVPTSNISTEMVFTNSRGETYHPSTICDNGDYIITWTISEQNDSDNSQRTLKLYLNVSYPN